MKKKSRTLYSNLFYMRCSVIYGVLAQKLYIKRPRSHLLYFIRSHRNPIAYFNQFIGSIYIKKKNLVYMSIK